MAAAVRHVAIESPYSPRRAFLPFHNSEKRWAALVAHRRAGKTVACINHLIRGAAQCTLPNPRLAYIAPLFNQAKDVAWSYLKDYTACVPGVEWNETELRADLPGGARVRLYGADNPDRLRGLYLDGVVLDEHADMDPRMWSEVIRPALSDRQGWAVFIGTPKGRNGFFEIVERAKTDPDWFVSTLKASETGLLPEAELADARRAMTEDQYAQEYECSFTAAIQGAYYGREMNRADDDKRICGVPWDPAAQVWTAWDLGVGDSTVIWFAQQIGREVHLIDYVENNAVGLDWYVNQIKSRPYVYAEHLLPHDAEARELGSGKTRVETLQSLGLKVRTLPQQSIEDGINAARLLIPRCWFDKAKCERGIEALRQYRRDWDDKLKTFKGRPLHDWTSHAADAFRYLAQGLRKEAKKEEIRMDMRWVV